MSSALRETLRAKVFSAAPSRKLVPLGKPAEGEEQAYIEVVQPLVGDMLDSMDAPSMRHRIARMMINSCHIPGTAEKLFEEADFDSLMALPADSVYQGLMAAITANISPTAQEATAKKP